jgi:hypothetical protein
LKAEMAFLLNLRFLAPCFEAAFCDLQPQGSRLLSGYLGLRLQKFDQYLFFNQFFHLNSFVKPKESDSSECPAKIAKEQKIE